MKAFCTQLIPKSQPSLWLKCGPLAQKIAQLIAQWHLEMKFTSTSSSGPMTSKISECLSLLNRSQLCLEA